MAPWRSDVNLKCYAGSYVERERTALAQPDDLHRQARAFQRKVNSIRVTVPHGREVRLHAVNDALAIPATLAIERQVAQRGLVGRKPELLDEVVVDITGAHADVGHASAPPLATATLAVITTEYPFDPQELWIIQWTNRAVWLSWFVYIRENVTAQILGRTILNR